MSALTVPIPAEKTRVLYIGMKHDYGDPKRGLCHEYVNFYDTVARMDRVEVYPFFYDEVLIAMGRDEMNEKLIAMVKEVSPKICFFVLFTDEIKQETIRWITEKSGAQTFNWFADDHWRFDLHSKYYAPEFHWVVTTDHLAIQKYKNVGCSNVILSQWAFNSRGNQARSAEYLYDVSFIGQVHSTRKNIVSRLKRNNILIECWGRGWKNGRISGEEMREKFVQSKINLNFTSSANAMNMKRLVKIFLQRRSDNSYHLNSPNAMIKELTALYQHQRPQIKGRNFEIPGHGGFLLTEYVDEIETYYQPNKEIVLFKKFDELVDKISFYLKNESVREQIRVAGKERTLREHTYEKRFQHIFTVMLGK